MKVDRFWLLWSKQFGSARLGINDLCEALPESGKNIEAIERADSIIEEATQLLQQAQMILDDTTRVGEYRAIPEWAR